MPFHDKTFEFIQLFMVGEFAFFVCKYDVFLLTTFNPASTELPTDAIHLLMSLPASPTFLSQHCFLLKQEFCWCR